MEQNDSVSAPAHESAVEVERVLCIGTAIHSYQHPPLSVEHTLGGVVFATGTSPRGTRTRAAHRDLWGITPLEYMSEGVVM